MNQLEFSQKRLEHLARIAQAGADNTPEEVGEFGPMVILWRRFEGGVETREELPEMLAEWTLAAIPECEPNVRGAKITRNG